MAIAEDILNYAKTILQQPQDFIGAGLPSGGGENDDYAITSDAQMLFWATEGFNRLARLCVPISDSASVVAMTPGQSPLLPNNQIASISGRLLHTPTQVYIGGRQLVAANVGFLNSTGNWYPPTPGGDPTGWANPNTAIMLSGYTTTPTFTIDGYFISYPLTSLSQPVDTYFDDFAQMLAAFYLAWRVATKNLDNSVLATRAVPCMNEFVGGVKEIYARDIQNDPTLPAIFPASPIDTLLQNMKALTPKT